MGDDAAEDRDSYFVVVNHEEQYSIWLSDKDVPLGWKTIGEPAPKSKCLGYIDQVWTDMRPLSVRLRMDQDVPVHDGT